MKVSGNRLFSTRTGAIIAVAYGYGLLLGVLSTAWSWAFGRGAPKLEWWQYALAPFAIGAAALVLEGLGTFLMNGFSGEQSKSALRRIAGKVAFIVGGVLLVVGWPIYQISQQ